MSNQVYRGANLNESQGLSTIDEASRYVYRTVNNVESYVIGGAKSAAVSVARHYLEPAPETKLILGCVAAVLLIRLLKH
jgi:hypothetical protein